MRSKWCYTLQNEANRTLQTAKNIHNGFYRINGFTVLPHTYKKPAQNYITFYDFDYLRIPGFWNKVAPLDITQLPVKASPRLILQVASLLEENNVLEPKYQKLQKFWQQVEDDFFMGLKSTYPQLLQNLQNVYIYPTNIGSWASFNLVTPKHPDLHIYIRYDQDVYALASGILLALTRNDAYFKYNALWGESQFLIDWLVGETKIKSILQKSSPKRTSLPSLNAIRCEVPKDVVNISKDFYKKIGLSAESISYAVKENDIYIDGKVLHNISQKEQAILKCLIEQKGTTVSVDALGDVLFNDEDDFSMYAISKAIERLRKKLEFNGISGSIIRTVRGAGFELH